MDFQESAYWGCFLAEMPFLDDIWLFGGVVSRLVPAKTSSPTIYICSSPTPRAPDFSWDFAFFFPNGVG